MPNQLTKLLDDLKQLDPKTQKELAEKTGTALSIIIGSQIAKRQVIKGCRELGLSRSQGKGVWRLAAFGSYVVVTNAMTGHRASTALRDLKSA